MHCHLHIKAQSSPTLDLLSEQLALGTSCAISGTVATLHTAKNKCHRLRCFNMPVKGALIRSARCAMQPACLSDSQLASILYSLDDTQVQLCCTGCRQMTGTQDRAWQEAPADTSVAGHSSQTKRIQQQVGCQLRRHRAPPPGAQLPLLPAEATLLDRLEWFSSAILAPPGSSKSLRAPKIPASDRRTVF